MKHALSIGLLIIISFRPAMAQNNLPAAYKIITDTAIIIRLDDTYWQMLEDPEGKLTIDEVSRSPIADKFHANNSENNAILELIIPYTHSGSVIVLKTV